MGVDSAWTTEMMKSQLMLNAKSLHLLKKMKKHNSEGAVIGYYFTRL